MVEINYLAILVCSVVGLIVSTVWYSAWGKEMAKLHKAYAGDQQPKPGQILLELTRTAVLSTVIAVLFSYIGVTGLFAGLGFGVLIWVGFPVVLLTGSVLWEKVPVKLATLHAADWLIKLLIISAILGVWR